MKDNVFPAIECNQKFSIATLSATNKVFDTSTGRLLDTGVVNGDYEWNYV